MCIRDRTETLFSGSAASTGSFGRLVTDGDLRRSIEKIDMKEKATNIMKSKPIILVAGEPYSVFYEIFFINDYSGLWLTCLGRFLFLVWTIKSVVETLVKNGANVGFTFASSEIAAKTICNKLNSENVIAAFS